MCINIDLFIYKQKFERYTDGPSNKGTMYVTKVDPEHGVTIYCLRAKEVLDQINRT